MMINFGNRYSLLARLIRNLHDTVINEKISTDDSARFFHQITNSALDVHLSDLEKHQEWQNYLATSKVRGKKKPRKAAPPPPPHQPT